MRYCLRCLLDSVVLLLLPAGNHILTSSALNIHSMLNYNPTPILPSLKIQLFFICFLFLDIIDFYASVSFRIINEIISISVCKLSNAIVPFDAILENVLNDWWVNIAFKECERVYLILSSESKSVKENKHSNGILNLIGCAISFKGFVCSLRTFVQCEMQKWPMAFMQS